MTDELCNIRVKALRPFKNCFNYIDVSHSRQPLVKGERLVRCERKTATIAELENALVERLDDCLQWFFVHESTTPKQQHGFVHQTSVSR